MQSTFVSSAYKNLSLYPSYSKINTNLNLNKSSETSLAYLTNPQNSIIFSYFSSCYAKYISYNILNEKRNGCK